MITYMFYYSLENLDKLKIYDRIAESDEDFEEHNDRYFILLLNV